MLCHQFKNYSYILEGLNFQYIYYSKSSRRCHKMNYIDKLVRIKNQIIHLAQLHSIAYVV